MKSPSKLSIVPTRRSEPSISANTTQIARLVSFDVGGEPLVDFAANPDGPRSARHTLSVRDLRAAVGREVLVMLDSANEPVIVGILAPSASAPRTAPEAVSGEALVDGERVIIRGAQEIVLECGEASITLRANGRIVIRGTYVETRASQTNRIRGGSVKIN